MMSVKEIVLNIRCDNCGEDIQEKIIDFSGKGVVDVDLMIDEQGFDCSFCNKSTAVILVKDSF